MNISWSISEMNYTNLISKAVTVYENNYDLQKLFRRFSLTPDEPLEILFLGGSITMGYTPQGMLPACYAALTVENLKKTFHIPIVQEYNLGYSSFSAILGLSVLNRNKNTFHPHIAVVEFAVNNGFEREYVTCFEGIIQTLLFSYPSSFIIIISAINAEGYTCEAYMKEIASHYHISHISISSAISLFSEYGLSWKDYSTDMVHPNQDGHIFLSDCIRYILMQGYRSIQASILNTLPCSQPDILQKQAAAQIPPCFGDSFASARYYDADKMPGFLYSSFHPALTHPLFPCGIESVACEESSSLMIYCKKLYLIYEQSNQMHQQGQIHILVLPDNQEHYINSYSICSWGNPVIYKLIDGATKSYTINIHFTEYNQLKKFTILGFLVV
ncbi:SGNH/GDSL hydrolase family protein [Anaeromicropila populeti]|uniref:SGNH/GDSL hydrolase family protein n=1 Tax=Anaeromicropila populeti TaxID=37658 RepID=A0A1I6LNP7_9FIRM|nr:SGNH/GDSL hydrolase family protein [Anaeromicropila populeti]SFS05053.1 hypothetical protein SAMN05661086_03438 [Anaeromicropila populeti]